MLTMSCGPKKAPIKPIIQKIFENDGIMKSIAIIIALAQKGKSKLTVIIVTGKMKRININKKYSMPPKAPNNSKIFSFIFMTV
jgi:hypothetical protein